MTTAELIEILKDYPQDSIVVVDGYEGGLEELDTISTIIINKNVNEESYYGDHEEAMSNPKHKLDMPEFPAVYLPR